MATGTPRRKKSVSTSAPSSKRARSYAKKIAFISKYETVRNPDSYESVSRQYNKLKNFPSHLLRNVRDKETLAELKKRGFFTTKKGVVVDGPRDSKRKPIKGSRVSVSKSGVVKFSVKQRRDLIIGFTKQEKKEFALDPAGFTKRKLAEIKKNDKTLKAAKKKPQIRLQWGAYQAQKDFSLSLLFRYLTVEGLRKDELRYTKKGKAALDRLTGLHIVIHIPMKGTNAAKKKGASKRAARKRK